MNKSFSPSSADQEGIFVSFFPRCNFEVIPLFVSLNCIPGKFGLQVEGLCIKIFYGVAQRSCALYFTVQ